MPPIGFCLLLVGLPVFISLLIGLLAVPPSFSSQTPNVDWENPDQLRSVFWQHWRYNRADRAFQHFLQTVPVYVQWDDHEVINDFGASWSYWNTHSKQRRGYQNLVHIGREALFLYAPIDRHPNEPNRIYRSFRWGKDLEGELFNFGFIQVQEQKDGRVHLLADVRGEDGRVREGSDVDLTPQP